MKPVKNDAWISRYFNINNIIKVLSIIKIPGFDSGLAHLFIILTSKWVHLEQLWQDCQLMYSQWRRDQDIKQFSKCNSQQEVSFYLFNCMETHQGQALIINNTLVKCSYWGCIDVFVCFVSQLTKESFSSFFNVV